jgi:hypothetical protein
MIYRVVILLLCFSTVCVEAWKKAKYDREFVTSKMIIRLIKHKNRIISRIITYKSKKEISKHILNGGILHMTEREILADVSLTL